VWSSQPSDDSNGASCATAIVHFSLANAKETELSNTAAMNILSQNNTGAKPKVAGKANSNHVKATRQADSGQISGNKVFQNGFT